MAKKKRIHETYNSCMRTSCYQSGRDKGYCPRISWKMVHSWQCLGVTKINWVEICTCTKHMYHLAQYKLWCQCTPYPLMSIHRGKVRGGGEEGRGRWRGEGRWRGGGGGRGRLHSNLCQTHSEEAGCSFDSTTPKHSLAVHPQTY